MLDRRIVAVIIAIIASIIVVSIVAGSIQPIENEDEIIAKREAIKAYMNEKFNDTSYASKSLH